MPGHAICWGAHLTGAQLLKSRGVKPGHIVWRQADIICVLQDRLLLSDVSVAHCCADIYVDTAAATAGSAAEGHAAKKVAKYALREPGGYDFTRSCLNHMVTNALPRIHS